MTQIDRRALVTRHNPVIRGIVPMAPLSVGNGEFAFTADLTGMQTFPEAYEVPLSTQSQWGWHSSGGRHVWKLADVPLQYRDGERGGYPIRAEDREETYHWLRQNPHRLQLGEFGFRFVSASGESLTTAHLTDAEQTLDLWSGILTSRFRADGVPVSVQTVCHPQLDQFGVVVESPLLAEGRLEIAIRFPAPGMVSTSWDRSIALNWGEADSHSTECRRVSPNEALIERTMDDDGYRVAVGWSHGELMRESAHAFWLKPGGGAGRLEFAAGFARSNAIPELVSVTETIAASERHWESFWSEGGAIEMAGSRDPRAAELERRIVQSLFLTAIHCAGSLPPQETGLLYNSWFGKFHLEMHWWHAFHFPLWGRAGLLRKSMGWYRDILPAARELAKAQGYEGARWPKMVAPDGVQSPSPIGPLLIWQQPHPIALAELLYLADRSDDTLEQYGELVFASADFMASFALWDEAGGRYVLGPPVIPAQERHKGEQTWNPTYELEYWRHGLDLAEQWAQRLGRKANPKWADVRDKLSALPEAEGVYLAHENAPDTFVRTNTDHPSMLGAFGMLPGHTVDRETMRRTLDRVMESWSWGTTWGWDYPMAAMTAARLGDGKRAVDLLLMDVTKNTYLPNGHNYQRPGLMAYLPGNGGLLTAVAMMACGWQGGPECHAPGFPDDGSWNVRWEGLHRFM
ncbi:glycoside hydrolase family 65 [Paenibacillus ginsengarvi]|uniref:Glycoside hydrolase family 65 n=1 Tax=Paenibacillus ginsengarvi TaxID=400777 RepID=A0A3B0BKW2_9BACL|nr:glycoside hydrolase family 65 [Paenibacillus ginsengarvi]RKN72934.1 glycoside hydrolase family 65 [Paenibacillus ginsengarvi]